MRSTCNLHLTRDEHRLNNFSHKSSRVCTLSLNINLAVNFVVSLCIRENNHPPSVKSRLISSDFLSGQFDRHVPSSMIHANLRFSFKWIYFTPLSRLNCCRENVCANKCRWLPCCRLEIIFSAKLGDPNKRNLWVFNKQPLVFFLGNIIIYCYLKTIYGNQDHLGSWR